MKKKNTVTFQYKALCLHQYNKFFPVNTNLDPDFSVDCASVHMESAMFCDHVFKVF